MAQSLTIKTLTTKTANGPKGPFTVWVVNGKWEASQGKWSAGWAVGGKATGIFKEQVSNGRTYYKIGCPPELMPKNNFGGGDNSEVLKKLDQIISMLQGADAPSTDQPDEFVDETPMPDEPEDMPSDVNEEIDIDSIE